MALDRIRGLLIGGAIGDALGSPHEMYYNRKVPYTGRLEHRTRLIFRFHGTTTLELGQISDDTEMTLALARTLIADHGHYDRSHVIESYLRWANSGSPMMGTNTRNLLHGVKTLRGYQSRYNKIFSEPQETWSQSNGSLMRASPLAVIFDNDPVIEDCTITNPYPVNQDADQVYVNAIRLALQGQDPVTIFNIVSELSQTNEVREVLNEVARKEQRDLVQYSVSGRAKKTTKGWVLHGLYCAMYSLLYFNRLEDAFDWIIGGHPGSDTDTNAAIAGNLLGAVLGYDRLLQEPKTAFNIPIVRNCTTQNGDLPRPPEYTLHDFDQLTQDLTDILSFRERS